MYQRNNPCGGPTIPPPPPEDDMTKPLKTSTGFNSNTSLPSIKLVKNDYNQHFVDTGERPQNFIRDYEPHLRFTEYPKLERLIRLKDEINKQRAHPPLYMQVDLKKFDLRSLDCLFDVVLIDPPWQEYAERAASYALVTNEDLTPWSVDEMIQHLKIDEITDVPSFCFIWCGSSHLAEGRKLLQTWGFRRCEDICWCKTNTGFSRVQFNRVQYTDDQGIFQRTKEHCLMGVKGVVRRSEDTCFIHSNIDTDIIVAEEPTDIQGHPTGSTEKPIELYEVIDRFCLGRRKLELFGSDRNIRPGWITIGKDISVSNYDKDRYISWVSDPPDTVKSNRPTPRYISSDVDYNGGRFVGTTPEIEALRPKSPTRPNSTATK